MSLQWKVVGLEAMEIMVSAHSSAMIWCALNEIGNVMPDKVHVSFSAISEKMLSLYSHALDALRRELAALQNYCDDDYNIATVQHSYTTMVETEIAFGALRLHHCDKCVLDYS